MSKQKKLIDAVVAAIAVIAPSLHLSSGTTVLDRGQARTVNKESSFGGAQCHRLIFMRLPIFVILSQVVLMLCLGIIPAWAFDDAFSTDPGLSGFPTSFTRILGGDTFTFTFTSDGDAGNFSYDNFNGSGNSASIFPLSASDTGAIEKITITRAGSASFVFTSIYIANFDATFTVTVAGYKSGSLVGSSQTVTAGNASNLSFGGIIVDEVRITATNIDLNFDEFQGDTTLPPTITSATYNAATGVLAVTGTDMTTGDTIAVNKLTLTGEGGSTYTLTTSNVTASSATAFSVTLNGTDVAAVNQILNKNGTSSTGGTTFNLAAADDWDANVTTGDTSDATNALTVSAVPVPTITSATYDAATGALVVTGTGFLKLNGSPNDIDSSKLTLTGEGGATYTLTDSADVEITSGTSFTLSLSLNDIAAVNQIMNKIGTSSTGATPYNLAAAEDWAAGADPAVNVADVTGNGVTVSNVAVPTITSATYDAATGALAVTGTGFLKLNGAPNDIYVSKLTLTGEGGATYTLTDSMDVEITSGTSFTLSLSWLDIEEVNQIMNKIGTSSTGATLYNLAAAEDWARGADPAVVVADLTGNGVTVSNVAVPTITSATYNAATGALVVTGTGFLPRGATNDIDASMFTLTGEGEATYTLTDTADVEISSGTRFRLSLSVTDKAVVNQIMNKNGTSSTDATTYNLAAAEDWAAGADSAVVIADATGNGVTVSDVPVPTITSAAYNATTGVLVVTGTDFFNLSGTANDINVSKLTLTGEGGSTHTLTSTNVEITSGTVFFVMMNGTDKAAVNQFFNKDGIASTSGTTYNLAAAEDWAAGADAAVTVADLTGNGVTVSNVFAPMITSATYNASTGTLAVSGAGFVKLNGATNDIVVSKLTLKGEGGATYTLTTTSVEITSGTAFTVTLNGTDKGAVNLLLNKNGTSSTGGTTYNLAAEEDWAAGADATVNVADLTGNGVTVSNTNIPPAFGGTFTTGGTVNDNATTAPFSGVTISDTESDNVSVAITYTAANGTLTGTGLTGSAGSYTLSLASLATATSNLQGLVFHPTANQVAPGSSVVTTFTLTPSDAYGSGSANNTTQVTATSINDAPVNSGAPAVSGTSTVAGTLAATSGTWTDADHDSLTYTYQWYRANDSGGGGEVIISGATNSSYTLTVSDAHKYLRAVVTANDDHDSADQTATSTRTVIANTVPVNTAVPAISGTNKVGNTLTASSGTWADTDGDSPTYTYQWLVGGSDLGGETLSILLLTTAHSKKTITCLVTANDGHGGTSSVTTVGILIANSAPVFTGTPRITGRAKVGNTLGLADTGTSDADGDTVTLSYQWAADGVEISGATLETYQLTAGEEKKTTTCTLTANDGNSGVTHYTTSEIHEGGFPWLILMPALSSPNKVHE